MTTMCGVRLKDRNGEKDFVVVIAVIDLPASRNSAGRKLG